MTSSLLIHQGSCHCGAVVIEVSAPKDIAVHECNCSMCTRTGFLHLIVAKSAFQLIKGEHDLTTYTFNTGIAKHYFCKLCGCKPFYVPRSNPDGFSVNVRCLNQETFNTISVIPFDGQNWEQKGNDLAHLSQQ